MKGHPRKAQIVDGRMSRPAPGGLVAPCPRESCQAPPGWRCRQKVAGSFRTLKHNHKERGRS